MFADRVTRNLREGRIVVLIVGDEIRPEADELVAGLQAHANFHFTFALVEMPVYSRRHPDSVDEFIVVPRTLMKTVTVPRFTIRTEGGSTVVSDAGTDPQEVRKPSRRSTISSEEFFEAIKGRSPDIPDKLKQFLDEVAKIDVRAEYLAALNLKWDQPEGKPVNLGHINQSGEIWTNASFWTVDQDLADAYNQRLAQLFGGKVYRGTSKRVPLRTVVRHDGTRFRIEDVANQLTDWCRAMEDFQGAIRARAQGPR